MAWIAAISRRFPGRVRVLKLQAVTLPSGGELWKDADPIQLSTAAWTLLLSEQEVPKLAGSPDIEFINEHGWDPFGVFDEAASDRVNP